MDALRRNLSGATSEVFFSTRETSGRIRAAVARGEARELGPRLYTANLDSEPEDLITRNVWPVVAGYAPGAVLSDRTGFEVRPVDGSVCVIGRYTRDIELPGLRIRMRKGPGRLEGDTDFLEGLVLASEGRKFMDNLRPSRTRGGFRRTLAASELEDRLERLLSIRGDQALNDLRDQARRLVEPLGADRNFTRLDDLIGTLLGTRQAGADGPAFRARVAGLPLDMQRVELFDVLLAALNQHVSMNRPAAEETISSNFHFWEAYFSNYIEGTVFSIEEAQRIVFENYRPPRRSEDAHDVLGTFRLASDPTRRADVPRDAGALMTLIADEHRVLMAERPDKRPGEFKEDPNQAGSTTFVRPELVRGTLHEGFKRYQTLEPGFARSAFQMFMLSEVHPFDDGNGRVSRLRMNAELSSVGQQRIIVPTAYRTDYLGGLRRLSREGDPRVLLRVLDRAQDYSWQIDWNTRERAEADLRRTNAFEEEDLRPLRLPSELVRA